MRTAFALAALLAASASAQNLGTLTAEEHLPLTWQDCTSGSCSDQTGYIVLDSNWRWTHDVVSFPTFIFFYYGSFLCRRQASSTNCYTGNEWDPALCPDSTTCTENCAIDGVDQATWDGTYSIASSGSEISLKFVTQGPYST